MTEGIFPLFYGIFTRIFIIFGPNSERFLPLRLGGLSQPDDAEG